MQPRSNVTQRVHPVDRREGPIHAEHHPPPTRCRVATVRRGGVRGPLEDTLAPTSPSVGATRKDAVALARSVLQWVAGPANRIQYKATAQVPLFRGTGSSTGQRGQQHDVKLITDPLSYLLYDWPISFAPHGYFELEGRSGKE